VPESWEWVKLDDYLLLLSGQDFPPQKYNSEHKGIPYIIGASNIENEKLFVNRWTEEPSVISILNDVLVVCKGAGVGKIAMNNVGDVHIARQIQAIRDETDIINSKFIKLCIASNISGIIANANGLIPGLKRELLLSLIIPVAPIEEQSRIVTAVEQWFTLIDSLEKETDDLSAKIRQIKSSILDLAIHGKLVPQDPNDEPAIELLKRINPSFVPCDNAQYENVPYNWAVCKVKDVFRINPKTKADDGLEAGFVPMSNIQDSYNNSFSYDLRTWENIKKGYTHFENGDIVVAKISPCLENRKSAVMAGLPNGIGAGTTELNVFRSDYVHPLYGLFFFKSDYFISQCIGTFNGVVGQQRVSTKIIEDVTFPVPPLPEQERIINKVNELFQILLPFHF